MIVEQSLSKTEIEMIIEKAEREKVQRLKTAAFRDWQHKLHRNDQLPRGRFFKGKKAGKPVVIMDEFHMYFKQPSNPFPYQPTGNFDANCLVTKL
ncbi:hypothetical protein AAFN31_004014 [Vibrio parahaemolyticus]